MIAVVTLHGSDLVRHDDTRCAGMERARIFDDGSKQGCVALVPLHLR